MNKTKEDTVETPKRAPMDFAELRNDTDFITKSTNLEKVCAYFFIVFLRPVFFTHSKFNTISFRAIISQIEIVH